MLGNSRVGRGVGSKESDRLFFFATAATTRADAAHVNAVSTPEKPVSPRVNRVSSRSHTHKNERKEQRIRKQAEKVYLGNRV